MQIEALLGFFCKAVEAVVVLGGSIDNCRVWLLYPSLAELLNHARRIFLYVAGKFNQCATGLRTHNQSIPRSMQRQFPRA